MPSHNGGVAADAPANAVDEESFYEEHRAALLERLRADGPVRLQERGAEGTGLMNQGATCYMNSLLQALFYTPEFRKMLFRFRHDPATHGAQARCIPLQLQRLFSDLKLSRASALSTRALTDACGFSSRDTSEQHDVQELCRVLFDALEQSSSFMKEEIHRLFAGQVRYWIRTREEHAGRVYESARSERFLDLQVPIQDCDTLEEALRALLATEELDGDNQWFCEDLGEKVPALKGVSFESVPEVMCIQLMRFVFDLDTMRRKKLHNLLSCPLGLDLGFLLGPGEPRYYRLTGVCLHSGTAHGGHYHAYTLDPYTGAWRDCNDSHVSILSLAQTEQLFRRREGAPATDDPSCPVPVNNTLRSSDAYFLIYRRVGDDSAQEAGEEDLLPEDVRADIAAENARLEVLQRAYAYHRKLREVRVFGPQAASTAFRRYVEGQLQGLVPPSEEDGGSEAPGEAHVAVSMHEDRPIRDLLARVRAKLAARAAEEGWSWAAGLDAAEYDDRVRLRRYDVSWGAALEPLGGDPATTSVGAALGPSAFSGDAPLLLEIRAPGASWEAYDPAAPLLALCRFDGAPVLEGLLAFRVPCRQDAVEAAATPEAAQEPEAAEEPAPPSAVGYDPYSDDPVDLFVEEAATCAPDPSGTSSSASPFLRDVREAAAKAYGLDAARAALVALSGAAAGRLLEEGAARETTLRTLGVAAGDVLCVEEVAAGAGASLCAQMYEERRNRVRLSFNHPDRPEYEEEFGPISVSKDATLAELKASLAEVLGLSPESVHLCKQRGSPQLKEESKTLREVGLAESSTVHVGHGAPCGPDENVLRFSLYLRDKDGHKAKEAFSLPAKGSSSVRSLREAVLAPLAKWVAEEAAARGVAEEGEAEPLVSLEGVSWRRLRLRDGQAGKQFAILRDERTLRSALLGVGDGRQVAVQVLDAEEELGPGDIILAVRPWRVRESKLHAPTELAVKATQTLAEFQSLLNTRFKGLLLSATEPDDGVDAEDVVEPFEDSIEAVTVPTVGPPLGLKRCETLKWSESRLNAIAEEARAKKLSEYKELRDGVTLVVRSQAAGVLGPLNPSAVPQPVPPKSKAPGLPPRTLSGNGAADRAAAGAPRLGASAVGKSSGERGLVIRVAHPEGAPPPEEGGI